MLEYDVYMNMITPSLSGRSLPLKLMHTCALVTYLSGAIYLVEKIIRYGI